MGTSSSLSFPFGPENKKGRQPGEANAPEQGLGLNKRPPSFTPSMRIAHLGIMSLRQSTNGSGQVWGAPTEADASGSFAEQTWQLGDVARYAPRFIKGGRSTPAGALGSTKLRTARKKGNTTFASRAPKNKPETAIATPSGAKTTTKATRMMR
jgi:hypothetical protein